MTPARHPRGRGRPGRRHDVDAGGPAFDDPQDSDAGRMWLALAGVEPEPAERRAATPVDAPPPTRPPAPVDLGALLTRASDLPVPPPRSREAAGSGSGPTPLPWSVDAPTAATGRGGAASGKRREAGRRGGEDRRGSASRDGVAAADAVPATAPADEEPQAHVIGAAARDEEPEASGGRPTRRRRPGPAPLPLEPRAREEAAREVVLRQLAMGPRSRGQLERKLAERGAEPELTARVLDRFEEVDLVDDAAFAETWVRSRRRGKRLSRRAISRELHEKGVDREVAEQALESIDPEDERAAALELVRQRQRGRPVPSADTPEGRAERDRTVRRLVGMLGRKGYGPGLAFGVVTEVLAELED